MLGPRMEQPGDRHLPGRAPNTCAWPGSPRPTPPAGRGSTTRRSTTSASPSASSAAWCRSTRRRSITLPSWRRPASCRSSGESVTGRSTVEANELSEAIIDAVVDEHTLGTDGVTRFRVTKRARVGTGGRTRRTRRSRLSGDWSLRRPGREGPAPTDFPCRTPGKPRYRENLRRAAGHPPLRSTDAAQAAAAAALRRHRRRRARPRWCRGSLIRRAGRRPGARTGALGRAGAGRSARGRLHGPGDRASGGMR